MTMLQITLTYVALKNPNSRYDMMFKFHAIHEEHGHLALLAAQMRRIKMQDGTSLYDNYRNDGTFMETKKGNKANIRGSKKITNWRVCRSWMS